MSDWLEPATQMEFRLLAQSCVSHPLRDMLHFLKLNFIHTKRDSRLKNEVAGVRHEEYLSWSKITTPSVPNR